METPQTPNPRRRRPFSALVDGLTGTHKVPKPADSMLNIEAGEGALRPPSDPPAFRAAEQSAEGRGRPRPEPWPRCSRG